jgi:hypothetical protein
MLPDAVPMPRRIVLALVVAGALLLSLAARVAYVQAPDSFASRIAELSEPAGYFDTDNLISNEQSYLHVVPALRSAGLKGGAYIGVGPDQNFTYIAQVRPSIAFIIDVRRDNLLLHLLFKALFSLADTRVEYLSLLFGRPVPASPEGWRSAAIDRIVAHVDGPRIDQAALSDLRGRVDAVIKTFGVPLSEADLTTIDRFHRRFVTAGLSLKFQSYGRQPQSYYPTYRDLLLETDRQGVRRNFLVSEEDFQSVRSLQRRDLVIPVVGDLAGPRALAAIGRLMASRGDTLAAFYASNVEFYLFRSDGFSSFVANLKQVPYDGDSLIIRSVFGALGQSAPGYYSSSLVQNLDQLLGGYAEGRFRRYSELTVER